MRIDPAVQTFDLAPVVLELPGSPVTRAAALMGHGDDLNGRVGDAVDHGVRKTPKKKFSRAMQVPRPTLGTVANLTDGLVELSDESICGERITLGVPEEGGSRFRGGLRVKVNAWTSHGIARRSDDVPPTTERASPSPCPDRRCGARPPYSTPPRHPRPPAHLNFPADDRPTRRALRREDAALLVKLFCGWGSWSKFYNSRC